MGPCAFHESGLDHVVAYRPGQDQCIAGRGDLKRLVRGELPKILPHEVQVDPDDHFDRFGDLLPAPVDERGLPEGLPDDHHLPRGNNHDVRRFRPGDGNPLDVEGAVEQDRLVCHDMDRFRRERDHTRFRLGVGGHAAEESKAEQASRVDEP